ncbi:hypothetical protein HHI36_014539 [Cryptolaemus montrouzieri]|uniref:Uncharacterized protein n=1 Tax=Cryptolaemus montrouzieri TaxID=559131 RepID=A0ABD2N384_9CUCU
MNYLVHLYSQTHFKRMLSRKRLTKITRQRDPCSENSKPKKNAPKTYSDSSEEEDYCIVNLELISNSRPEEKCLQCYEFKNGSLLFAPNTIILIISAITVSLNERSQFEAAAKIHSLFR